VKALNNKEILAENIKKLLKKKNATAAQLAAGTGLSKGMISDYLAAKNFPREEKLDKIAKYFGLSSSLELLINPTEDSELINELVSITNSLPQLEQEKILAFAVERRGKANVIYADFANKEEIPMVREPLTAYVAAGLGELNYLSDETVEIPENAPKHDYVYVIKGDSMSPEYEDGDIVLGKKEQNFEDGGVYVFTYDGAEFLKLVHLEKDRIRFSSFNEDYPDFYGTEYNQIRVLARILSHTKFKQ